MFTEIYERVDRFQNHLEIMVVLHTFQQIYNQQTKHQLIKKIYIYLFCETRTKRSVEVYRGRNLDPPPPTDRDRHLTDPSPTVYEPISYRDRQRRNPP